MKTTATTRAALAAISGLTALLLSACDSGSTRLNRYFEGNEWYLGNEIFFRNDSTVSYSHYDFQQGKMVGDTTFPITLTDSTVIYTFIREKVETDTNRRAVVTGDSAYTDTVYYDILSINNQAKMILYLPTHSKLLTSKKRLKVKNTNNFQHEKFTVNGYSIGDFIDHNKVRTRGVYHYQNYTIEDCELKENKDIKIKLIGANQIYAIEMHNIPDYRIDDAIKVINNKLGAQPDYAPMRRWRDNSDYEYEFFMWSAKGVRLKLERTKYVGKELFRNLLESDNWTMHYDDDVMRTILVDQYSNGKPTSAIID